MKAVLVTVALGATIFSMSAVAQERGGWANRDETRQQAQQRADAIFQRFDVNHDGVVTRAEAEQVAQQLGAGGRAERIIERLFGSSQSLTVQQVEAQVLARFDRQDLNHDGIVTAAERQQAQSQLRAERAGQNPGQ